MNATAARDPTTKSVGPRRKALGQHAQLNHKSDNNLLSLSSLDQTGKDEVTWLSSDSLIPRMPLHTSIFIRVLCRLSKLWE